jgi:hypothetical protein
LRNGAPASRARRRDISVLPTPVGPIIKMFFGNTSSRSLSSSCSRRQRLRNAIATARLASPWPMMKRSSSDTISRGGKVGHGLRTISRAGPIARVHNAFFGKAGLLVGPDRASVVGGQGPVITRGIPAAN